MPLKEKPKVCGFCGPYEKCSSKYHNLTHIRDLLVDANIIEDTDKAFNDWFCASHNKVDKEHILLGHDPSVVWNVYKWRVATFVRGIL